MHIRSFYSVIPYLLGNKPPGQHIGDGVGLYAAFSNIQIRSHVGNRTRVFDVASECLNYYTTHNDDDIGIIKLHDVFFYFAEHYYTFECIVYKLAYLAQFK